MTLGEAIFHITGYSKVQAGMVACNGTVLHENSGDNVADFLLAAYDSLQISYPKFYKMDILSKLGIIGVEVLLRNFDRAKYKDEEIGIVLSNANASVEADAKYLESVAVIPSPALFVYTLPNIVIGELSIKYKFKGENAFFISESFDADWLFFYVNNLMEQQGVKACICGWVDVLDNAIDGRFFLVERDESGTAMVFNKENLNKLYV